MSNIFDWKKIYSKKNAVIVEMLLDRKIVPFDEIVCIFGIDTQSDNNTYLIKLINPWRSTTELLNYILLLKITPPFFTQEYFYFQFCMTLFHDWTLLNHYYIPNLGKSHKMEVNVDKILSLMIREERLPIEICRLPRLKGDQFKNSELIPDYYEEQLDYNASTDKEIIFHARNYCPFEPITLTYYEVIKRITQNGHPESLLKTKAQEAKIAIYLQVSEESIINDSQMRRLSKQSLEYFRESNCGNPSYIKRYKGLERLMQNNIDTLFGGNIVHIKDNDHCIRMLSVQLTDIETKFHLQRYVKSCVQIEENGNKKASNNFQLKDTLYLLEDIDALIFCATQMAQATNEDMYNGIELTIQEIALLLKTIPNETATERKQRLKEMTDRCEKELKQKYPNKIINRGPIIKTLRNKLTPLYQKSNKTIPSLNSCLTNDREMRRTSNSKNK